MLNLERVAAYIPDQYIQVEDNFAHFGISQAQAKVYSKIYGLRQIPSSKEMSIERLLERSIEQLIAESHIPKEQIHYLIHSHTARVITEFGESVIARVKKRLALNHALSFGVTISNCAATITAYEMAAMLLKEDNNPEAYAVVVTGEKAFTSIVQVIPNTSITGDASACVLVSTGSMTRPNAMLAYEMVTDGRFSRGIWLDKDKSKIFEQIYPAVLAKTIETSIRKAGLQMDQIKIILPHNVNRVSWASVAKILQVPLQKIYLDNVKNYAHCFGADIMINYCSAMTAGLIQKGDYFVMATVGLGATFAAAVFQH